MVIEGEKNLQLMKRAFLSHLTVMSQKYLSSSDAECREKHDPELAEINKMLDAIEINLARVKKLEDPASSVLSVAATGGLEIAAAK